MRNQDAIDQDKIAVQVNNPESKPQGAIRIKPGTSVVKTELRGSFAGSVRCVLI